MDKNFNIESETEYSTLLRKNTYIDFNTIKKLSTSLINKLPKQDQDNLFDKLSKDFYPLESEMDLSMSLYKFGEEHYERLIRAFENLPKEIFDYDLEIIDYGCGQGIGEIVLADYLRTVRKNHKIKSITLIEPTKLTLKRAALHTDVLFLNSEDDKAFTIKRVLTVSEFKKEFCGGEQLQVIYNSYTGESYLKHKNTYLKSRSIGKVSKDINTLDEIKNIKKPMLCLYSTGNDLIENWYLYDASKQIIDSDLSFDENINDVEIYTINKDFDNLNENDFTTNSRNAKLHIFPNFIDDKLFDINHLSRIVDKSFEGLNYYLLVSPFYGESDSKFIWFNSLMNHINDIQYILSEDLDKDKWKNGWTSSIRVFYNINHKERFIEEPDEFYRIVNKNGFLGFMNSKGNFITNFIFNEADLFLHGIAKVKIGHKWGCIYKNGNLAIDIKYDKIDYYSEDYVKVKLVDKWGLVNKYGELITNIKYDIIEDFVNGMAMVKVRNSSNSIQSSEYKFGFIDINGKEVITPKYDWTNNFYEDLAAAQLNGKSGFIDKKDNVVIEFKYDEAFGFSEGLSIVSLNNKSGFIDKLGNVIIPLIYDRVGLFKMGYTIVVKDGISSIIDRMGKEIINNEYRVIEDFSDSIWKVGNACEIGLIDNTEKMILKPIYETIQNISEGISLIKLNKKYGFINIYTGEIINCKYDDAHSFCNDLAVVCLAQSYKKKWGYIDKNGTEVIAIKYDYAEDFHSGLAVVGLNIESDDDFLLGPNPPQKYGLINKRGIHITEVKYDKILNSYKKDYVIVTLNGKCGLVDKSGNEIIALKYDEIYEFSEGRARVKLNGKCGFIDINGKEITDIKYDYAERWFCHGLAKVELNDKVSFIDLQGNEISDFIYDSSLSYKESKALFPEYRTILNMPVIIWST